MHIVRGRNALQSAPSKTAFGGLRKWDLCGQCPFRLWEMTGRRQTRGKRVIGGGGVQNVFLGGRGVMVCFRLP